MTLFAAIQCRHWTTPLCAVGSAYIPPTAIVPGTPAVIPPTPDLYVDCRISGGPLDGASSISKPQGAVRDISPNPLAEAVVGYEPWQAAFLGCLNVFPDHVVEADVSLRSTVPIHFLFHRASDGSVITTLNEIRRAMLDVIAADGNSTQEGPRRDILLNLLRGEDGHLPIVSAETRRGSRLVFNGHHRLSALISLVADGHLSESILDSAPLEVASSVRLGLLFADFLKKMEGENAPSFSWLDVLSVDEKSREFAGRASLTRNVRDIGADVESDMVAECIRALNNSNGEVRQSALRSLGAMRSPQAVKSVIRILGRRDQNALWEFVPEIFRKIFGNEVDPLAVKPFLRALGDQNARVRLRAAAVLGAIGYSRKVESLMGVVGDEVGIEVLRAREASQHSGPFGLRGWTRDPKE